MAAVAAKENGLQTLVETQGKQIESLTKSLTVLTDRLAKTPANGQLNPSNVFIRHGENSLTSRGFSFQKMLGLITGACEPEQCKVEVDVHNRLHNCYVKDMGSAGYTYKGGHRPGEKAFVAPLSTSFMSVDTIPADFRYEMKSLVAAGVAGADMDEARWALRKAGGTKALSWLNELTGGALVAPPEMGELIELLRNKEALVNAGARTVPLPPQGRIQFPRQTSASTTYWVGENSPITGSDIGTGTVSMQAKKLAVLIQSPQELIRFASPAVEALIRDDMTKSLALGLDLAGLEGAGGDTRPLGIILRPNINTIVSSGAGANGDKVVGQDIYRFIAAVEESNAAFESFIMRPKTMYKYLQLRADAVGQGDAQGPFLFSLIREAGDSYKPTLAGYPVVTSTQVSQVRSKGSASNLTYILGGMFSDVLIGMFGAIEFSATNQSDTAFINDQSWVKGILSCDIAVRHEAAFAFMDSLGTTL